MTTPVLVLAGASGFIGTRLVEAAKAAGYEVRRLVRSAPERAGDYQWDPASGTIDTSVFDCAYGVICLNGAGLFSRPWTASYKRVLWDSRIDSVCTIADSLAARAQREGADALPQVFIAGSAVGFYGSGRPDTDGTVTRSAYAILTESSPNGTGFLAELCMAWESEANRVADLGIRTVNARTGLVMGQSGGMLAILQHPYRIGLGARLGDGENWMPTIARDDYVRALLCILREPDLSGPVNMTSPDPVPNKVWHRALADHFRRPGFLAVPELPMRITLGDFANEAVLASQRVMPQKLLDHGFRFIAPTVPEIFSHEIPVPK
ncbi:TIGR01777 family oxidoreductase [Trueperella bialowiezensis]|uniref:Epimerase family protein SA0724 n=1 Tax=Trueperella bialowiezensis TaxID=312285 RepID=A0A3S4Z479_9ACTO|nr:TIGR01777 family oxidoreductase [Trueperella bialowiezensis]VEI12566.1 Epimerase family protein SA0724 [Trueperella bialowiezensis]